MVLVAICMVAIIAMAALSIDVVTLYLNHQETQRGADAAALAAARVISLSGITGTANPDVDTAQWQAVCGPAGTATQVAQQVGAQNAVGGTAATVTVTYSAQGATGGTNDCSTLGQSFAINPTATVQVTRTGLPTLFARIWSRNTNTVSATAAAEVFNPSDSGVIAGGEAIPVIPRCVKPLIIPDEDPVHAGSRFISSRSGRIANAGIYTVDAATGVIGESFTLVDDCSGPSCPSSNPPTTVTTPVTGVQYIPAQITTTPAPVAVPSCSTDDFQNAMAGCDESTQYQCGTANGATANLTTDPGPDMTAAVQCLTNMPTGNDTLNTGNGYPYTIIAGSSNPLAPTNQIITSSNSIMTIPIYDDWNGTRRGPPVALVGQNPTVTIVGFLQVFVAQPLAGSPPNSLYVTVLNVAGCGDRASTTASALGSSPVPIRLITPQ
jgi:hypothetical protein